MDGLGIEGINVEIADLKKRIDDLEGEVKEFRVVSTNVAVIMEIVKQLEDDLNRVNVKTDEILKTTKNGRKYDKVTLYLADIIKYLIVLIAGILGVKYFGN